MNKFMRLAMVWLLTTPAFAVLAQDNQAQTPNLLDALKPQLTLVESNAPGAGFNLAANGAAVKYSFEATLGNPLEFATNTATLAFRAAGDGLIKARILVAGFEPYDLTWTLPPQPLAFTAIWPPPGKKLARAPGTEKVEITIQPAQGSVALLEQPSFRVAKPQKPQAAETKPEPTKPVAPVAPDQSGLAGLVNIVSEAKLHVLPYGTLLNRMRDSDDGSGVIQEEIGDGRAGFYEFYFDRPREIALVRFFQAANYYVLAADVDGDRKYEKTLAAVTDHKGSWYDTDWVTHKFDPPVKARGIMVLNISAGRPMMEMEIYERGKALAEPKLESGVPEVAEGEAVPLDKPSPENAYLKGVVLETWMFDWLGWRTDKEQRKLADWPPFKKLAEDLKDWNANLVEIFPPVTRADPKVSPQAKDLSPNPNAVLWPSQYAAYSIARNDMSTLCDTFHGMGIKVKVVQGQCYWCGFKADERDKAADPQKRYQWQVERWAGLNAEQVASRVDGVSLCMDEEPFGSSACSSYAPDKAAFKKQFGYAEDPTPGDTETWRRWKLATYEVWAKYIRDTVARIHKLSKADFFTFARFGVFESYQNSRPQWGGAYDILGHQADLDYFETDPYHTLEDPGLGHYICAATTKRILAAHSKKRPIVTLNPAWTADIKWHTRFPPVSVYGPAIASAMQGGGDVNYWRYNFFRDPEYHDYYLHVKTAFSLLDTLAAWGGRQAQVPRKIAVLKSRASEDWWYMKVFFGQPGNQTDRARGFFAELATLELLLANGYPFQMFYLDQPADYADLAGFKLIVIPFAYSVPKEALPALEKAAKAGAKIVVLEKAGETDAIGNAYPEPLLKKPAADGWVELLNADLTAHGTEPAYQRELCGKFDAWLGKDKPLYLNRYGNDIEATMLEKANGEKLVLFTNWTKKPVTVDGGVQLPAGEYTALKRDLTKINKLTIGGKDKLTEKDLSKFRLKLAPLEVNLLRIIPVGKK